MSDLDTLYKAKSYIDKLANGINPLTDEPVKDDDVLNDVKLTRCFFYVSDVLRQVIENGGEVQKRASRRIGFNISDEDLEKFEYSDEPIVLTHVIERINGLINQNQMKKLRFKTVISWLREMELLEDANGRYGTAKVCPTEEGQRIGLSIEKRIGYRGEYFAVYYNRNAQEFIINHVSAFTK